MMHKTLRLVCCLLVLALLTTALPAFADSAAGSGNYHAYVTSNTMKVYKYPNKLAKLLGTMSYGEDVKVLAWQDGWFKLKNSKGRIGYCEIGSLSLKNPCKLDMYGYVKEAGAYVYAKPESSSKVIASAEMGDELHVVGMTRDKNWLRVENKGKFAYVPTQQLSKTPTWISNGLNTPD